MIKKNEEHSKFVKSYWSDQEIVPKQNLVIFWEVSQAENYSAHLCMYVCVAFYVCELLISKDHNFPPYCNFTKVVT